MDDNFSSAIIGGVILLIIMGIFYFGVPVVHKTTNGQYYIRTHGEIYKLANPEPVKLEVSSTLTPNPVIEVTK